MSKNLVLMTKEVVHMVISRVEVIGKEFIKEWDQIQKVSSMVVLRRYICDSTEHFMKNCEHEEEQDEVNMNVQITLSSKPEDIWKY